MTRIATREIIGSHLPNYPHKTSVSPYCLTTNQEKTRKTNLLPNPNPQLSNLLVMLPRHHENVPLRQGHDIQKGEDIFRR